MITSLENQGIKKLKTLIKKPKERKIQQCFIVEGIKMFQEIPEESLLEVYVSETFLKNNEKILKGYSCHIVSDSVFDRISDTVTPQGILAVVKKKIYEEKDILCSESFVNEKIGYIILENLQDPGNMGTIIRTAEGAGMRGIFLDENCVDAYSPKVVRATMGSIFRMPICISSKLSENISLMKKKGVRIYGAALEGKEISLKQKYFSSSAFVIGNEAKGISKDLKSQCDELIRIPMKGKVESLNAGVSAGIIMYNFLIS